MSEKKRTPLFEREEIRELIDLLEGTDVAEIEVENEGRRVRLRRGGSAIPAETILGAVPQAGPGGVAATPAVGAGPLPSEEGKGFVVKAPIVGSFYRSPSPEAPPFAEVGATVNKGQVICIIEAMKLMNEIESEISGTVRKVFVQNGESVEYGQPLFVIDPV